MKKFKSILALFALLLLLSAALPSLAPNVEAQSGGGYDLTWYTIDSGGAQNLQSGSYTLSGTIGQVDAGSQSGGSYALKGGYWVELFGYRLELPLILK